jgi:succinoglycan biosynthesis protein ExoA
VTVTGRISVVAAMLNEEEHVESLVGDLAGQDFAGEVEIFVADGGSTDRSRECLARAAEREGLDLTIVDNPRRIVSTGLNACIERCRGNLIVRVDCHSRYPPDYLTSCVRAAEDTGAWNVGGVYEAVGRTPTERAVASALATPFGGVNWTRDVGRGERVETDTVYLGAFRPIAFERAGPYSESLVRNQDDELNLRIRRAGGRIVLDPSIRAEYTPRGTFRGLARQYYEYGFWKSIVMAEHRQVLSARSLAPAAFVASLAVLGTASGGSSVVRRLLAAELALYAAAGLWFGLAGLRERKESPRLLARVAAVYPTLHFSYGVGMIAGALRPLRRRRKASGPAAAADAG